MLSRALATLIAGRVRSPLLRHQVPACPALKAAWPYQPFAMTESRLPAVAPCLRLTLGQAHGCRSGRAMHHRSLSVMWQALVPKLRQPKSC